MRDETLKLLRRRWRRDSFVPIRRIDQEDIYELCERNSANLARAALDGKIPDVDLSERDWYLMRKYNLA